MQHDMARQLVRFIEHVAQSCQFEEVLELGCGTGLLTELLVQQFAIQHLTLNDIVPDLAQRRSDSRAGDEKSKSSIHPGDMESIQLPADQDLVTSNAVLQWATDPEAMLEEDGCRETRRVFGDHHFWARQSARNTRFDRQVLAIPITRCVAH